MAILEDKSNKKHVTVNWQESLTMASTVASDKTKILNTLSFPFGKEIVEFALSPDGYQRKNGEIVTNSAGERKLLTHPIQWGQTELGYTYSQTYDANGKQIKSIDGNARVIKRKFDESAIQLWGEFVLAMEAIPTKHELYWHFALAWAHSIGRPIDPLFKRELRSFGIANLEKLRFFKDHLRDSKGLRSPEYITALWEAKVKETSLESERIEAEKTAIQAAFEANGVVA